MEEEFQHLNHVSVETQAHLEMSKTILKETERNDTINMALDKMTKHLDQLDMEPNEPVIAYARLTINI